nr:hypothetical protein [Clostridium felsineum]
MEIIKRKIVHSSQGIKNDILKLDLYLLINITAIIKTTNIIK